MARRKIIVGFGNKARNGKDTLAAKLQERLLRSTKVLAFADDLKALARALGMQEKNGPFLQQLGAAMRTLNKQYWIAKLEARMMEADADVILIPDVRYRNEVDWITAHGGLVVRVSRIMPDGSCYRAPDRPAEHPSECELDGPFFDLYYNIADGDMLGFEKAADSLATTLLMRYDVEIRPALPTAPYEFPRDLR